MELRFRGKTNTEDTVGFWLCEGLKKRYVFDEAIAKSISDRDVVRLCSTVELEVLQEKFATRDQEVTNEMMNSKATTPIGAALSRLKKIGASNPTLMKLQM
ncbi:unnamed protein product [Peronospora belbahrii]|uniref:Uncharacterized protein n=1 Tax=Peronospora belbahrii TaxID=622444 RepID=A0ABN8CLB3_9STRA|nr:unnamed protein product [Peronospora belbahrii]